MRERDAREELRATRQEFDSVNDALAQTAERERGIRAELREARRELGLKDGALDAAEQEVAAIKSEISRIAPLLQLPTSLTTQRPAEIVPLAPIGGLNSSALAQPQDDGILRAWTEIDAAARRIDFPL